MVTAISGFPGGQSIILGQVAVILTYFNKASDRQEPDGVAKFMFVNVGAESQKVAVALAVAYNSDFFHDWVQFERNLPPHSVQFGELAREQFKAATFARFHITLGKWEPSKALSPETTAGWPHKAPSIEANAEHFLK